MWVFAGFQSHAGALLSMPVGTASETTQIPVSTLGREVQKPVNQMCLQCPRGAGENGNGPLVSEALPRFAPIWDLHDPGGEDRLSPVSPALGKGEKLACTESLIDARLSAGCPPHIPNTQTQPEDAYKATHDTQETTQQRLRQQCREWWRTSEPLSFCPFRFIPPHLLWPPLQRPCGQQGECGGWECILPSPMGCVIPGSLSI